MVVLSFIPLSLHYEGLIKFQNSPFGQKDGAGFDEVSFALLGSVLTIKNPFPGFGIVDLVSVAVRQEVNRQKLLQQKMSR